MTTRLLLLLFVSIIALRADTFDAVRLRYRELLLGPDTLDTSDATIASRLTAMAATAQNYWNSMDKSAARTWLWSDLPMSAAASSTITGTYSRLRSMAAAYARSGCPLYGNPDLLADIESGLDWMHANVYNEQVVDPYDNWWDWEIGVPLSLNDIATMLYDGIGTTRLTNCMNAVDRFSPSPAMTGANLMWKCKIVGYRGVLVKDSAKVSLASGALGPVFAYVWRSDGFYVDGSFIQHGAQPYAGGYGKGLLGDALDYIHVMSGSPWEVAVAGRDNVYQWLRATFEPLVYNGEMMDMVRGREISRYNSLSHTAGRAVAIAFIRACQVAPAEDAAYFRTVVKAMLQSDTTLDVYGYLSIHDVLQAKAILGDPAVVARAEPTGFRAFPYSDRMVQLRPGWGAGLSMHSTRIYNFELGNQENLRGWHTGDGMLYVYTTDQRQFSQNFWPTVDPYRLPGTTVEAGLEATAIKKSGTGAVGGLESYDGQCGVATMGLAPYDGTLRGNKAWFFFDDEIVCLGEGLSAAGGRAVETVVENRRLDAAGSNAISVNGAPALAGLQEEPASPVALSGVQTAHLVGSLAGADLGYYFPQPVLLKGVRERRTHAWTEINQGSARAGYSAPFTNNYFTLWFDHGVNPVAGSYAYAILPGFSAQAVQDYAAAPDFTVLENSAIAQAVKENTLGMVGAVFVDPAGGTVGAGDDAITADARALVGVRERGPALEVAVADPAQLNGTITIALNRPAGGVLDQDPAVTVTRLRPTLEFTVDTLGLGGRGQYVRFNLAGSSIVVDSDESNNTSGSTVAVSAGWSTGSVTTGVWGGSYLHDGNAGQGTKRATFTPGLPVAGDYEVSLWYPAHANRADNTPVDIVDAAGTSTVLVNQRINGSQWVSLGVHTFDAGTGGGVVIRNDNANGYVVADAVRFAPTTIIVDDDNSANPFGLAGLAQGDWPKGTLGVGMWGGSYLHDNNTGQGEKSMPFTPTLPEAGNYEVFLWYVEHANRADNVPVDVVHSGGTTTLSINERTNGGRWVSLGTYAFEAGQAGRVVVRNDGANGYVVADAIKFERR